MDLDRRNSFRGGTIYHHESIIVWSIWTKIKKYLMHFKYLGHGPGNSLNIRVILICFFDMILRKSIHLANSNITKNLPRAVIDLLLFYRYFNNFCSTKFFFIISMPLRPVKGTHPECVRLFSSKKFLVLSNEIFI